MVLVLHILKTIVHMDAVNSVLSFQLVPTELEMTSAIRFHPCKNLFRIHARDFPVIFYDRQIHIVVPLFSVNASTKAVLARGSYGHQQEKQKNQCCSHATKLHYF